MASGSNKGRKPTTGPQKPKNIRKRVSDIPQLDDDQIYKEVLEGHFEEVPKNGKGKRSRRRTSTSQRKWWWPKKSIPTTPEREALIGEVEEIYYVNDYVRDGMPHEYLETHWIQLHLNRLKSGLIPTIPKKGITNVKARDSN